MIRRMELELILIQMEPSMLGNGKMINRMALEFKSGWMGKDTKGSIEMELKLGKEY